MRSKGECPSRKPVKKIVWSWVGSFSGIFLIFLAGQPLLSHGEYIFLIGSFGASAVLIYGAPMAEFSQPRNLIGGHFFSAIVGVTIYLLLGSHNAFAGSLAVSLSVVVMHFTRTLHPPGGATALIAVIGDEKIHALGYAYIFKPVLTGSLIMLMVALIINNLSTNPKRHYPVYWI
jgi:CBS-domain-containing membrane protein